MASSQDHTLVVDEEKELLTAIRLARDSFLPMAMRAAIELHLFEIMAKASHDKLSASEIASYLPTQNPQAPATLERMLRFLVSNSILTSTLILDEEDSVAGAPPKTLYGLTPLCKYFVPDQHGVSLAPSLLLVQDKQFQDIGFNLKDAVLEGGIPFNKAHGMHAFEYAAKDDRFNELFNKANYNETVITMRMMLEKYKGFEGVKEIIDVGGGVGAALSLIISKYPAIKGINFDLPHVIEDARPYPGVEHIGGDMFESVPKGEVIFMKHILHGWSDDDCLKVLKNCFNALTELGKVIVLEAILPEHPDTDPLSENAVRSDVAMLGVSYKGKERRLKEYEALARESGFVTTKLICRTCADWIMEFHKTM